MEVILTALLLHTRDTHSDAGFKGSQDQSGFLLETNP